MTERTPQNEDWGQSLSDLADGRATPEQVRALSAAWAQRPDLRRDWEALHLIGDTLRSAELAQQAQSSAELLATLRLRIAREPQRLQPRRWRAWASPLAVAAGFVLFALALPLLESMLNVPGRTLSLQAQGASRAGPDAASTLTGGQPSFAQSVAEPTVRAVSLQVQDERNAVAPFDLAVPPESSASGTVTSALPAR